MKSSGIIRRIDDLGRLIVPSEIRRKLKIHEGDPFEIFITDGGILFKKYTPYIAHKAEMDAIINSGKSALKKSGINANITLFDIHGSELFEDRFMDQTHDEMRIDYLSVNQRIKGISMEYHRKNIDSIVTSVLTEDQETAAILVIDYDDTKNTQEVRVVADTIASSLKYWF